MAILPKSIYSVNTTIKISAGFFADIDKLILKFIGKRKKKKNQTSENDFEKEQSGRPFTSRFQNLLQSFGNWDAVKRFGVKVGM